MNKYKFARFLQHNVILFLDNRNLFCEYFWNILCLSMCYKIIKTLIYNEFYRVIKKKKRKEKELPLK